MNHNCRHQETASEISPRPSLEDLSLAAVPPSLRKDWRQPIREATGRWADGKPTSQDSDHEALVIIRRFFELSGETAIFELSGETVPSVHAAPFILRFRSRRIFKMVVPEMGYALLYVTVHLGNMIANYMCINIYIQKHNLQTMGFLGYNPILYC